ncbi:hypothetical protein PHISP_06192 [Aspergillus sp. HF37]|nr:hypothetical protein PHISP_06192 [Aspergillus sp. HF37]
MRDQQTSAALGLPPRIHDEDCNVPRLVPSDLAETDAAPDTSTFGKQQEHHIFYLIEMVELAKILRNIISIIYSPTGSSQADSMRAFVQRLLTTWESGLDPELKLENTTRDKLFLVGMLHMTYK